MPELSEVELTRRDLLPRLRGRRILDFWTDWPRALRAATSNQRPASSMRGRKIFGVTRRGKVLFFKLSGKPVRVMAIHLRMSGRLVVTSAGMRQWDKSERSSKFVARDATSRWVHFVWRLSGGLELRLIDPRKFGRVWYGAPDELRADPYLGALGDDPHRLAFPEFHGLLRSGRGRVKPFLLRQDRFAGIGNIIADEALWRARIHPCALITRLALTQARDLHRAIAKTIGLMLDAGGTTLRDWGRPDGRAGRYQEQRLVYGRAGKPCPRCGTRLLRIVVGGRGTTICSQCQQM